MSKFTKTLLVGFFLSVLLSPRALAGTINAASCSRTDVGNAVASAADGDTVVIPSCPSGVSWTSKLTITKGITLQGQGIGQTVIIDDVPKGNSSCGMGIDQVISFSVNEPLAFRLTGMTIRGSAGDSFGCNVGHVALGGTAKMFRIDNMKFENMQTSGIGVSGWLYGVIHDVTFQGSHKQGVIINHPTWGGASFGDGSWADDSTFGTEKAVYIEDCVLNDPNPSGAGLTDAFRGARFVVRFCTLEDGFTATHGTESSGRPRGVRQFEIYNNTFTTDIPNFFTAILIRGGTGFIHNNTFAGSYSGVISLRNFRSTGSFGPWGKCDGTSSYDQNVGPPAGYACIDQVGRGKGDLLSGDPPTPVAWPNQVQEPLYQWENRLNGSLYTTGNDIHILADRDFYNHVSSFNGTSGMGVGTIAQRPSTCTIGVGYWATDEGEWNSLNPGPDGRFYKCTATNTWTFWYTPFTYPHPLRNSSTRPQPPTSLRVVQVQ